jgi:hypothetical protein
MTVRRVTLTHHFQHIDGRESVAELEVDLIEEPATRWEPGCSDIEAVELHIGGELADLTDHATLINEIIEMAPIPEPDDVCSELEG